MPIATATAGLVLAHIADRGIDRRDQPSLSAAAFCPPGRSRYTRPFNKPEAKARGGNRERYEGLIAQNELLAACGIVKEMVSKAYSYRQEKRMRDMMEEVVAVCRNTGNERFEWFARLVEKRFFYLIRNVSPTRHLLAGILNN